MGVYINGMEMPKDGFITITVTSDGRVVGNSKKENGKFEYLDNEDIAKAVHVPPHGKLIAADARVNVQMYNDEFEDYQTVNMSIDDLLDSSWIELEDDPTIIPADPAEEGET